MVTTYKMPRIRTTFYSLLVFYLTIDCSLQKPLDAQDHLHTYGFLDSPNPDSSALKGAIKKFQTLHNLVVTGILDEATMEKMKAPRCGRLSQFPEFANTQRKWKAPKITYKVFNWTDEVTQSNLENAMAKAAKAWTNNINLEIEKSTSDSADITVYVTLQDGPSEVLGYAYGPENGDIYFDKDEYWIFDPALRPEGTYFGWVAVHELGHSLGLHHTESISSIMFPYYSDQVTDPSEADIKKIKSLYGNQPLNNRILCEGGSIDAILDNQLIIKGNQSWKFEQDSLTAGPYILDEPYLNADTKKIDAAFRVWKTMYIFSGNVFYKFKNGDTKSSNPKVISVGFENIPSNIDAAFFSSKESTIYFFKDSKYYSFNVRKKPGKRLGVNGKDISNDWGGIPHPIDAATLLENSRVLFIKGVKCYVVNLNSRELLSSEDCSSSFYNC